MDDRRVRFDLSSWIGLSEVRKKSRERASGMFMYDREITGAENRRPFKRRETAGSRGGGLRAMRVVVAVHALAQAPCNAAAPWPVEGLEPLMLVQERQFCVQRPCPSVVFSDEREYARCMSSAESSLQYCAFADGWTGWAAMASALSRLRRFGRRGEPGEAQGGRPRGGLVLAVAVGGGLGRWIAPACAPVCCSDTGALLFGAPCCFQPGGRPSRRYVPAIRQQRHRRGNMETSMGSAPTIISQNREPVLSLSQQPLPAPLTSVAKRENHRPSLPWCPTTIVPSPLACPSGAVSAEI